MDLKNDNYYLWYSKKLMDTKISKLNLLKLLRIGVKEGASFKETLRTELCNQFIFIGLLIVIIHVVLNLIVFKSMPDLYTTIAWFSFLFIGLILSIQKHTYAARVFVIYFGTLNTFVLQILFGPNLRLEAMYILFLVASALFFDFKLMIRSAIFITISWLLASGICLFIAPPFEAYISPGGPYTRFLFCIIMIVSLIGKLTLENLRYNEIISSQNEKLTESYQQLKSFNYIISHDLRQPIQSMVGLAQLIDYKLKEDRKIDNEILQLIVDSGKRLNKLIMSLVEFRDSTDKMLSSETFAIQEVVEELKHTVLEAVINKNVTVNCQAFPLIKSSKIALFIILKNLIENGIKYNNNENPTIDIKGNLNAGIATIKVADNGIGIEKESYKDVFTMFKRLNINKKEGTGIGLNIVENLVTKLNGEISICESKSNIGTTFLLKFPVELLE